MSGGPGNTSGRCPAFQNIPNFIFERGKEIRRRPSGRGPVMERIALFWKVVAEDHPNEANFRQDVR
jgi:hypothetical protein